MKKCPKCGVANDNNRDNCVVCGYSLSNVSENSYERKPYIVEKPIITSDKTNDIKENNNYKYNYPFHNKIESKSVSERIGILSKIILFVGFLYSFMSLIFGFISGNIYILIGFLLAFLIIFITWVIYIIVLGYEKIVKNAEDLIAERNSRY